MFLYVLIYWQLYLDTYVRDDTNSDSQKVRDTYEKSYCQLKILLGTRFPGSTIISQSAFECGGDGMGLLTNLQMIQLSIV